jgi:hypothetical protein
MSNPKQHELTITVRSRDADGVEAVARSGAEATGKLDLDDLRMATISVLDDLMRRDKATRREELEVLGQHLYRAIFTDNIPGFFRERLQEAKADKQRLRLQLTFKQQTSDLIRLPWEFLFDKQLDFLATRVDLVLSRYMPTQVDRTALSAKESPLRILVAESRVKDQSTVMATEVIDALQLMAKKCAEEGEPPIELAVLKQPTRQGLLEALERHKPHIFHFIGHGVYEQAAGKGMLALPQDDTAKTTTWCDDKDLIKIFESAGAFPRLVVLHMCEGGVSVIDDKKLVTYTGFGPQLIRAEIPAVVAMQYPIKNVDAKSFALAFYKELANGGSVDTAVQRGREQMGLFCGYATSVIGTPVLYMHSSDGIILPRRSGQASGNLVPERANLSVPTGVEQTQKAPPAKSPQPRSDVRTGGDRSWLADRLVGAGLDTVYDLELPQEQVLAKYSALAELRQQLVTASPDELRVMLTQRRNAEADDSMKTILGSMIDTLRAERLG